VWVYHADLTKRYYDTELYLSYMTINKEIIGFSGKKIDEDDKSDLSFPIKHLKWMCP